jgi:hypothetical protein
MSAKFRVAVGLLSLCMVLAGCSHKSDAISQADKLDAINGVAVPGIEQTKQIAQE